MIANVGVRTGSQRFHRLFVEKKNTRIPCQTIWASFVWPRKTKQTVVDQNCNEGVSNVSGGCRILRKPVSFSTSYLIIEKKFEIKVYNNENFLYVSLIVNHDRRTRASTYCISTIHNNTTMCFLYGTILAFRRSTQTKKYSISFGNYVLFLKPFSSIVAAEWPGRMFRVREEVAGPIPGWSKRFFFFRSGYWYSSDITKTGRPIR